MLQASVGGLPSILRFYQRPLPDTANAPRGTIGSIGGSPPPASLSMDTDAPLALLAASPRIRAMLQTTNVLNWDAPAWDDDDNGGGDEGTDSIDASYEDDSGVPSCEGGFFELDVLGPAAMVERESKASVSRVALQAEWRCSRWLRQRGLRVGHITITHVRFPLRNSFRGFNDYYAERRCDDHLGEAGGCTAAALVAEQRGSEVTLGLTHIFIEPRAPSSPCFSPRSAAPLHLSPSLHPSPAVLPIAFMPLSVPTSRLSPPPIHEITDSEAQCEHVNATLWWLTRSLPHGAPIALHFHDVATSVVLHVCNSLLQLQPPVVVRRLDISSVYTSNAESSCCTSDRSSPHSGGGEGLLALIPTAIYAQLAELVVDNTSICGWHVALPQCCRLRRLVITSVAEAAEDGGLGDTFLGSLAEMGQGASASGCHTLEELFLDECRRLRSVSTLGGCVHLRALNLSYCEADDAEMGTMLASLPFLHELHMDWCFNLVDLVEVLSQCASPLRVLSLKGLYQIDGGTLHGIVNACKHRWTLEEVYLSRCTSIRDVSALAVCKQLRVAQLPDYTTLRRATRAVDLPVGICGLVAVLHRVCPRISHLRLRSLGTMDPRTELSGLSRKLPHLIMLDLSECADLNSITDCHYTGQCLNVRKAVHDMDTLRCLLGRVVEGDVSTLDTLILAGCSALPMLDVVPLLSALCPSLCVLDVRDTGIDSPALQLLPAALPRLTTLTLSGCYAVRDVTPLVGCPKLSSLTLMDGTSTLHARTLQWDRGDAMKGLLPLLGKLCPQLRSVRLRQTGNMTDDDLAQLRLLGRWVTEIDFRGVTAVGERTIQALFDTCNASFASGCLSMVNLSFTDMDDHRLAMLANGMGDHLLELRLHGCPRLTDLSPLVACTRLRVLKISNTHVTPASTFPTLHTLRHLEELDIRNCPRLVDLRPLVDRSAPLLGRSATGVFSADEGSGDNNNNTHGDRSTLPPVSLRRTRSFTVSSVAASALEVLRMELAEDDDDANCIVHQEEDDVECSSSSTGDVFSPPLAIATGAHMHCFRESNTEVFSEANKKAAVVSDSNSRAQMVGRRRTPQQRFSMSATELSGAYAGGSDGDASLPPSLPLPPPSVHRSSPFCSRLSRSASSQSHHWLVACPPPPAAHKEKEATEKDDETTPTEGEGHSIDTQGSTASRLRCIAFACNQQFLVAEAHVQHTTLQRTTGYHHTATAGKKEEEDVSCVLLMDAESPHVVELEEGMPGLFVLLSAMCPRVQRVRITYPGTVPYHELQTARGFLPQLVELTVGGIPID